MRNEALDRPTGAIHRDLGLSRRAGVPERLVLPGKVVVQVVPRRTGGDRAGQAGLRQRGEISPGCAADGGAGKGCEKSMSHGLPPFEGPLLLLGLAKISLKEATNHKSA